MNPRARETCLAPHIYRIPTEILSQIFENLIPAFPEINETRPVEYHKLIWEEPWYERTRRRTGLRNCCLVSHKFRDVARPFLYRTAPIIDEQDLPRLLRTLVEKPEYGSWVRSMSVHITLTDEDVYRNLWRCASAIFKAMDPGLLSQSQHGGVRLLNRLREPRPQDNQLARVPQALLFLTLTLLPRVEMLLLRIPLTLDQDQPQYSALCNYFATATTERPCQALTKLLIQADADSLEDLEEEANRDNGVLGIEGCAAGTYWSMVASCPKLNTLEVYLDDGHWFPRQRRRHPAVPDKLPNIKRLYLNETFAIPQGVADALRRFPSLEVLYVEPRWSLENVSYTDEETFTLSLDQALHQYGSNLRRLDIGFFDCLECEDTISDEKVLTCLPLLGKLRQLCIQLNLLLPLNLLHNHTDLGPIAHLLPPSLEELRLEDWWWDNASTYVSANPVGQISPLTYSEGSRYREMVIDLLVGLASELPAKLPLLRKVSFLTRLRTVWVLGNDWLLEVHMSAAKEAFSARGIEFAAYEI